MKFFKVGSCVPGFKADDPGGNPKNVITNN